MYVYAKTSNPSPSKPVLYLSPEAIVPFTLDEFIYLKSLGVLRNDQISSSIGRSTSWSSSRFLNI